MAKALAILAVAGLVSGVTTLFADIASAQLSVGVTVVRSCAVDARSARNASPALRLTCTGGAKSTLRLADTPPPAPAIGSDGLQFITFNF